MPKNNKVKKLPKESLTSKAYKSLFEQIVTNKLAPGAYLDEKSLVEKLGIGRTPIREALVRLSSEHLIENLPNKGFAVVPITLQNTKAIFQAIWYLEKAVIDLAVSKNDLCEHIETMKEANAEIVKSIRDKDSWRMVKLNNDFHMAFARCSDNEYLVSALNNVRFGSARLAYLSFSHEITQVDNLSEHYQNVLDEHQAMITHLANRDRQALEQVSQKHLLAFQKRIVSYLTSLSA